MKDWWTMFETEYEDGDEPYIPTQWELYSCEFTCPTLEWYDRANSDFNIHVFLKTRYKECNRLFDLSLRASPFVTGIMRINDKLFE